MVHYHKPECLFEKVDCCVHGHGHSKISKCQWMKRPDTFWIAEPFSTNLGMVRHLIELDCLPKRLVCFFQGQGHSEGSYYQNTTV